MYSQVVVTSLPLSAEIAQQACHVDIMVPINNLSLFLIAGAPTPVLPVLPDMPVA